MTSIYVISADNGSVKVGIAKNPQKRLYQLRVSAPFPLTLSYTEELGNLARNVERRAHAHLQRFCIVGEWFNVSVERAIEIIGLASRLEPPELSAWVAPKKIGKKYCSGDQCRNARKLLGWSRDALARESKVAAATIVGFETSTRNTHFRTVHEICAVLEAAGVQFLAADGDAGAGVRLAKRSSEAGA